MPSEDEKLAVYLSEVRQLPLLTFTEEREGLQRAREGDESARRRVIEGHLELAALLALRLAPTWMRPLDAVQEANLVLIRLIDDTSVDHPAARLTDTLLAHFAEITRRLGK
jgi:DNA-directed RNA polymerase sigma subunit (sigma70/sigma32)